MANAEQTLFDVRPLAARDRRAFYHFAVQAFQPEANAGEEASRWEVRHSELPGFDPGLMRGVYEGEHLRGGCIVHERLLNLAPGSVKAACVGAVVTDPGQRGRGVARALLEDVVALAQARQHGLLFLDGVPGFYQRWDFTDVLEQTFGSMRLDDVRALPAPTAAVRPATAADAPLLHRLYERHFRAYAGTFHWPQAIMAHRLKHRRRDICLLALDEMGDGQGYLWVNPQRPQQSLEVAAGDWPAIAALLQAQAALFPAGATDETIRWLLPPASPLLYHLGDHLQVRCETTITPHGYWMARPAHRPTLMRALLEGWQARWQAGWIAWSGHITFEIEGTAFHLAFTPSGIDLTGKPAPGGYRVGLSDQTFVQLVFGYRPVHWYASQPGQLIPASLLPLLDFLFPSGRGFIPGTDHF